MATGTAEERGRVLWPVVAFRYTQGTDTGFCHSATINVPNFFVCDGGLFPTATAVNPSLTIEAVAARTADRIQELVRRGDHGRSR